MAEGARVARAGVRVGGARRGGAGVARELVRLLEQRHAQRVTLRDLADCVELSPFQVLRLFKRHCGLTPHQYLVQLRVDRASRMLLAGESIADVAVRVGFADQSHMAKHFKRLLGVTPSKYRLDGVAPRMVA